MGGEDPIALERLDAWMAEAYRRMASRDLQKYPHPARWAQLGHTNFPHRMGGRMVLNYIAAGGDARNAEIVGHAYLQWCRSLVPVESRMTPERLRLISCREERANGKVNGHQAALTGAESACELAQMEFDVAEQLTTLHEFQRALAVAKRQATADARESGSLRQAVG